MVNSPVILILAALPTELNLNKHNKLDWTKENIDSLIEDIKNQIEPAYKTNLDIKFTSVGKVNATFGFMDAVRDIELQGKNLNYIINIGSAGSIDGYGFEIGDIVQCDYVMQTDLDLSGILNNSIGTNINELNLSTDNKAFHEISSPINLEIYNKAICGSSDKFPIAYGQDWYNIKNEENRSVSVLDQELGALAVALARENDKRQERDLEEISFISLKYISNQITKGQLDGTESYDESGKEWLEDLWKSNDCQDKLLKGLSVAVQKIIEYEI